MANKKPKNKYDPLEGLSPEEKRQIEQQRNIFGLSSQEPQEKTESKTKTNNVMVEEDVLKESSLDTPEIIVEDSAEDTGEFFGDVTYENIFNHTSANDNIKTEKKDTHKKNKIASVNNDNAPEDVLPEDTGEILGEVSTPTSAIDKAIRDSVSDFRETTDGGLNKTEDDVAYEEEKTREFRERNAQNNDIIEEERINAEEEATQALEEALKAQEALDALAEDANDVSGQKGKGKKKKKGKNVERRLENNTGNAPVLVRPSTSSITPTNFTKPEAPTNQGSSPVQSDSGNVQPTYMPSGNIPEGNSGVVRKQNNNASDETSALREDTANKNNSVANIESQSVKSGTTDIYLDTGTKDTIIPNTDSPVIYNNDYIPQKETIRVSTDIPESGIVRETSGVSSQSPSVPEDTYNNNSKPPITYNYDATKNEPQTVPIIKENVTNHSQNVAYSAISEQQSGNVSSRKTPSAETPLSPTPYSTENKKDPVSDSSQPSQKITLPDLAQSLNQAQDNTTKNQPSFSDNNPNYHNTDTYPTETFLAPEQLPIESKPITPASVESIQFKPHHASIGQAVSNAESNNFIHSPTPTPIGNVSVPILQTSPISYIEEVKRTISNYVEPNKEVIVTETGSYITVSYDNKTVSIPKSPDIKPQSIPAENHSPAFDALVKKAVDGLQRDMPPVYSGNDIKTTEVVSSSLNKKQSSSQWNINDLNNNLKRDLGTTAVLQPTENKNVYTVFKGTDNEAYITFHPISHRVTNVEYVGSNPTQTAIKDISAIQSSAQSYADYCRTTENAFDYLSKKISQPQQEVSSKSPITQITGTTHIPFNRVVTNATQLTIANAPNLPQGALGYISTRYSNTFNPYTSALSSGAIAMRLRNSYTMVMPSSLVPQKGISPEISRLIALQENSPIVSEFGENTIIEQNLEDALIPQVNGTTKTSINDPSRATKLADKTTDIIHPNQFYSAINPAYNLSPLRSTPDFRSVINTARGLGIYVAMQVRQTAMQNPIGEGMQQMATYTILPLQMFHKTNPYGSLMAGLKYLPNYNSSVATFVKEARAIGINCVDNPTLFQITNISNRVYAEARALGFEPGQLTQTQIASELVKRQKWIKDVTQRPAGKSVEHINREMNTLKAISSAKELHFSKTNVSSFYVNFFKENGITLPPNITNLTDRGQFAMLRSIVDREIGGKYGIKDISQMSAVRLESLMKTHKFTNKELNILRLLSTPEMTRFSRLMKKADRRAMYFMLFLQRVVGQNDATQGAIKTFRWLKTVRTVIHYTRRVSRLTQRILMRVAHRHGWDKIVKANRVLTRNGRIIKNAPKKAGRAVGKGIKKGAKTASKNLAKTAVGKSAKKISGKFAQSAVGKIAKGSLEAITKTSAKVASKVGAIAAKKAAIEASISESFASAFGIGGSATAVGAGAGAGAGGAAGGATAGGAVAATESTPVGWIITLVVVIVAVVLAIILGLTITIGPGVIQGLDENREEKTISATIDGLTELDNLYINAMKDVRITHLSEEGDSEDLYSLSIGKSEAERFDISGYYDPKIKKNATLTQWGWGDDAKEENSIPDNNAASKLVPSFQNTLYEAHNRGATFSFTDSPQTIYYMHADDSALGFDIINNPNVENISFRSNTKEIISAVSVITRDEYSNATGYLDSSMSKDMSDLFKGYSYKGVRLEENIVNPVLDGSVVSVSLWSATHGYQTTASDVYACNGCKDFSYYCNSDEWKDLNNNNNFKFNKSTLTTLSGNAKALPYNTKGCYQHSTKTTLSDKSNIEYFCGNYHKTSSGKYVQCTSANNKGLYSGVVGHLYTDIYGLNTVSNHKIKNCNDFELLPVGTKTATESGFVQENQYYNHNCVNFNVSNCQDVVNVSNLFGTTAYFISFGDDYFNRFNTPSCASVSTPFFIKNNSTGETTCYFLIYCTGHHSCNTNTVDRDLDPVQKDTSVTLYYKGNTHSFYVDENDYQNAVDSAVFTINVYDYCTHYKSSTSQVTYQLSKKVCNGHCDGHTKANNDHPCVYCIGHKDKLVSAYVISSTEPEAQPSTLYDGEYGHWDCLPFNTIYSADTCSGPIALAREGFISENNIISGIADKRDSDWYLKVLNYKEWYADEFSVKNLKTTDTEKKKRISIASSNALREDVSANLRGSWSEMYDSEIFSKTPKKANGIFYGEYFGYHSLTLSSEWSYIESQVLNRNATKQQKAFVRWAIESCGRVPYYPSGTITGKWYDTTTKENLNNFGNETNADSAGRILYGVNESKWLNWCYASAFSPNIIEQSDGTLVHTNSAPKLKSSSVQLSSISLNRNYNFTPTGCSNLPANAKRIWYNSLGEFREGVQAGDIIILKKKCPLCCKMFTQGSSLTKCDNCDVVLTQDFGIVVGWADYAKAICKNEYCDDYDEKFKYKINCPTCGEKLEISQEPKGDDIFVIEMSSDACEENVVLKRYDERAFDISDSGISNEYVVYRFLN